jgi:multiple sugar transport system substrate-binding protein
MKKLLTVISLLIMATMLLAACAPAAPTTAAPAPAEATATQPAAAPAEATATQPAAAPAAATATQPAAAPAEPTATVGGPTLEPTAVANTFGTCARPLHLIHGLTGSDGAVFATLLTQFSKENPDICISSEGYPWDLFFQKYPTAVAAGTPPDMVIFHASEVQQMASEGLMIPMDDMFATGGLNKADYNPTLMQQLTVDGKIMAVPFDNHGWLLWMNTKLIKDAGLDPNNLPKNGTEFIQWAQKLTTDKNGKHPTDAGFDKDNVQVWAIEETWPRYTIPSTLWQFGAAVVSPDGKKATLDSPEAIAAVQYWHDLMYKYYVCPPAVPGLAWAGDLYKVGRMVFMWEGTWTQGFMLDNPDVAAITQTAFINSLAPDGKQAVKLDAHIMSIPTGVDAEGQRQAKILMTWLAKNGAAWSTSGQVPAMFKVQEDPIVQSHPSVAMAAKQFKAIGRTDTPSKYFIEIQTAWETAVGNALATADANVAAELKKGNEQIQAILDRP